MLLLINLSVTLFIVVDLFLNASVSVSSGFVLTNNYVSKICVLFVGLFLVLANLKNRNWLALSPIAIFPVLSFNRELLELKTFYFTFNVFDIYILSVMCFVSVVYKERYRLRWLHVVSLLLIFCGLMSIIYNGFFVNANAFLLAYVLPLLYLFQLTKVNLKRRDVEVCYIYLLGVSLFIFLLQNLYIGPYNVYISSVKQTWLRENVSIANGGLLEIGAMEMFLLPFAGYFLLNRHGLRDRFNKYIVKFIVFASFFVFLMPFIYQNRSNSLLALILLVYIMYATLPKKRFVLSVISTLPFGLFLLYGLVLKRSFSTVGDGLSINVFGIRLSGIDSTTFDHLNSTLVGFETLLENMMFGFGLLKDADSLVGNVYTISNLRNFVFPSLEIAISLGFVFFIIYLVFVYFVIKTSKSNYAKLVAVLQFLPVVGTSKFFYLYSTGSLSTTGGYASLTDHTPIAMFSVYYIGVILMCMYSEWDFKLRY